MISLLPITAPLASAGERQDYAELTDRVSIDLFGYVSSRCGFRAGDAAFENGRLDLGVLTDPTTGHLRAGSKDLHFGIDCNNRFTVSVTSMHGGLESQAAVRGSDPDFLRTVNYGAELIVERGAQIARNPCSSGILRAARCLLRVSDAMSGKSDARLRIFWDALERPLFAGKYQDRLIIRISPSVGGE